MSSRVIPGNEFQPKTSALEATGLVFSAVAVLVFGILVLATPWAYGGVESWYRAGLAAVLGGLMVLTALASLLIARPCSLGPLCLVMAPLTLLLAAATWQWWGGLFPLEGAAKWSAGTIYPGATELAITGLLAAIAAMFLGATLFSQEGIFTSVMVICLISATAVGFFGIAMRLTGDDQMIRGSVVMGTPFARFVNRNNAAAFMLLGLSSGIALLTSLVRDSRRGRGNGSEHVGTTGLPKSDLRAIGRRLGLDRQSLMIAVLVLSAVPLAGIVSSASRSGTISAAVVVCVGVCLLGGSGRWRKAALVLPALFLAMGLVAWLGLSQRTISRFESISWNTVVSSGRIPHWIDATGAMRARPVFGAGLGTYGYAYQAQSQRTASVWFQHADNQYVELAVEMGAAGGAILLVGLAIVAGAYFRGKNQPTERTLLATLAAGQLTHAVFDFGIVIPATTLPAAALAGAAVTRLLCRPAEEATAGGGRWFSRAVTASAALFLAGGMGWGFLVQRDAWTVGQYVTSADFDDRAGYFTPDEMAEKIDGLEAALAKRPHDAEGHRFLADLYYYGYRTVLSKQRRKRRPKLTKADAWRTTSPASLHKAIHLIAKSSALPSIGRMRQDDLAKRYLIPALHHYKAAATACPWLPGIRIPLQALAFLDPDRTLNNTEQIAIATKLFPADAIVMRQMAPMAWTCGDQSLAGECWKNAFAVSGREFAETLAKLSEKMGEREAVALVWPEKTVVPGELTVEAAGLDNEQLRHMVGERFRKQSGRYPAGARRRAVRAFANWLLGREKQAIEAFEKILSESPQNTDVRVDFAQLLWSSGRFRPAIAELRRALLRDPVRPDAQSLMGQWLKQRKSSGREP